MKKTPITIMFTLALIAAASFRRDRIRTQRAKVHEAGKGDGPDIHGVNYITTIELEEPTLDTWTNKWSTKQEADQKTIS